MSDERSVEHSATAHHHPQKRSNWLNRLGHLLKGEPNDRDELADIITEAGERDIIDEDTQDMLEGVFEISELRVRDIMIPRSQMNTLPSDACINDVIPKIIESGNSRYPVIHEDKDHIEGILLVKDLLKYIVTRENAPVTDIIRPAVVVPESKRVDKLLKEFQQCRYHMAIVVDEYGGVSGLVTIEDILELIVGEIEDEYDDEDNAPANITEINSNLYHVLSLTPIADFNEKFGTCFTNDEYDTIGGLVLHAFGHLPAKGDSISVENFDFKVLSADKRSIHLLQLTVNPREEE